MKGFGKATVAGVHVSFEAYYYLKDLKYIIRSIRKLGRDLPRRKRDADWLQIYIEAFLVMNSRFYEDLIVDFVREAKLAKKISKEFRLKELLKERNHTLSIRYHDSASLYRHRAAHGTNYLRVGIPEFGNQVLPKPMNYSSTQPLAMMARRRDFIKMWQTDMGECANDLDALLANIESRLS